MTRDRRDQSAVLCYDSERELEHDGVFRHTRNHSSQSPPLHFDKVNAEDLEARSAIAASSASSFDEEPALVIMELAHQLEAYARLQAQ